MAHDVLHDVVGRVEKPVLDRVVFVVVPNVPGRVEPGFGYALHRHIVLTDVTSAQCLVLFPFATRT